MQMYLGESNASDQSFCQWLALKHQKRPKHQSETVQHWPAANLQLHFLLFTLIRQCLDFQGLIPGHMAAVCR
jgi:hypothetical protein